MLAAALGVRAVQRGHGHIGERLDSGDARRGALAQGGGLTGQRHEGAARLLAGDDLGHMRQRHAALDEVAGAELGTGGGHGAGCEVSWCLEGIVGARPQPRKRYDFADLRAKLISTQ
jgi:hypothetical protein